MREKIVWLTLVFRKVSVFFELYINEWQDEVKSKNFCQELPPLMEQKHFKELFLLKLN